MRIAYIVDRFPVLSQTFVINEIADHLSNGSDVDVLVMEGERYADFPASTLPKIFEGKVRYLGIEHSIPRNIRNILRVPKYYVPVSKAIITGLVLTKSKDRDSHLRTFALIAELIRLGDRYDIIHTHYGHIAARVARARMLIRSKSKSVATIHAFEIARKTSKTASLVKALIGNTDLILSVNSLWRQHLVDNGASEASVIVHHMGVDVDRITPAQKLTVRNGKMQLVTTGRMVEKKGHEVLVEALAILRSQRPDIPFEAHFIGNGPLEAAIKNKVLSQNLSSYVMLRGALPHAETLQIVRDCNIFVLPSVTAADGDMEGIPVALMEAMAMAKPVVSTFHSGIPDLIETGVSGFLVKERDANALARTLMQLWDNPALQATIGQRGREAVEIGFNAKLLGQELRARYASLFDQKLSAA